MKTTEQKVNGRPDPFLTPFCTGDTNWSLSKNTAEMIMTNGTMTMKQASP